MVANIIDGEALARQIDKKTVELLDSYNIKGKHPTLAIVSAAAGVAEASFYTNCKTVADKTGLILS